MGIPAPTLIPRPVQPTSDQIYSKLGVKKVPEKITPAQQAALGKLYAQRQ